MCIACLEYTKDKLTAGEFQSALRETTMDDQRHLQEVQRLMREHSGIADELKKKLTELNDRRNALR
jgi:hypothetical protein